MGYRPPNYTTIPNQLLDDDMPLLGLVETRVMHVICRQTFGWHKVRERISLTYLMKKTRSQKTDILKAVRALEEKGLIKREVVGKNGTQKTFYEIIITEESNNSYQCDSHTGGDDSNNLYRCDHHTGTGATAAPIKETLPKETLLSPIIPKGDQPSASPSSQKRKKVEEVKQEVAERVLITPTQHNNLLKRLDGDHEKLKRCYERLSTWKIAKEMNGGVDYLQITKWVIRAVTEEDLKPKSVDRVTHDKSLVELIQKRYPLHRDIVYGHNYLEFSMGMNVVNVKFGEHGFKEQVLNTMRKMRLSVDGL